MKTEHRINLKGILSEYAIYFVLLTLIVAMSLLRPDHFPTWSNFTNILRQMTPVGLIALGVAFCIIAGGTNLSGGAIAALSGVVVASLVKDSNYSLAVSLLIPVLIGLCLGALNGVMVAYGRMPPFIATLGMMNAARGLALVYTGGLFISGLPPNFTFLGGGSLFGVPMPIVVFAICIIVAFFFLHVTRFGNHVYAVGGNEKAAVISGIDSKKVKLLAYSLAGVFSAIAGIIVAARSQSGQPAVGEGFDLDAITCAVIGGCSMKGGIGTIHGTVIGAVFLGVLINSMTMLQIDANWQRVVRAVIIVLALLVDMHKNRSK